MDKVHKRNDAKDQSHIAFLKSSFKKIINSTTKEAKSKVYDLSYDLQRAIESETDNFCVIEMIKHLRTKENKECKDPRGKTVMKAVKIKEAWA